MTQRVHTYAIVHRRIRRYQREILGTVFLTLAALGLLIAATFGQNKPLRFGEARTVEPKASWALMRVGHPEDNNR